MALKQGNSRSGAYAERELLVNFSKALLLAELVAVMLRYHGLSPTRALRARRGAPRPRRWAGYLAKNKEKIYERSMANHTTPPFQLATGSTDCAV